METFTLVPRGPFSLAASIRFLEGFTPAAYRGSVPGTDDVLELAFPVEGSWQTVGIRVRQDSARVTAEIVSRQAPSPGLVAEVRPQTRGALAPIAALRETSAIFGPIIGTLVFREPFRADPHRLRGIGLRGCRRTGMRTAARVRSVQI